MWMKPLSLFTFSVFLVMFGINLYTTQSDKYDRVGLQNKNGHQSLFEMEPEQARKLLDDLDVYVDKNKAMEKAKKFAKDTKKIKNSEERKRRLASTSDKDNERVMLKIKEKYLALEDAFLAREDNLLELRFMQDEIRKMKEENEIDQGNIEIWSTEFLFLLIIQERLGFDEIKTIKNPSDIGFSTDEWLALKAKAETDAFKTTIMQYKGIEVGYEAEEEIIVEQDFEPSGDRNKALKEFDRRNRESREGYAEESRQAEEISFSNDESEEGYPEDNPYDDGNDYYREPTSQEEGYNEEYDYEY